MVKYIINESQYKKLVESKEKKILHIPSLALFNNDWDSLQEYLKKKGNPFYSIGGDLTFPYGNTHYVNLDKLVEVEGSVYIKNVNRVNLGSLKRVGGNLELHITPIESLGKLEYVGGYLDVSRTHIKSLGNLTHVGQDCYLYNTKLKSFGKLSFVGNDLIIDGYLAKAYSFEEIFREINILGEIVEL